MLRTLVLENTSQMEVGHGAINKRLTKVLLLGRGHVLGVNLANERIGHVDERIAEVPDETGSRSFLAQLRSNTSPVEETGVITVIRYSHVGRQSIGTHADAGPTEIVVLFFGESHRIECREPGIHTVYQCGRRLGHLLVGNVAGRQLLLDAARRKGCNGTERNKIFQYFHIRPSVLWFRISA